MKKRSRSVLYFLGIVGTALALTLVLKESTFTDSQVYVLFLLFLAVGLWVTELIPPFSVGLLIIAYLVFAIGNPHINSNPEPIDIYVNTFSSSIIWLLLGGFFLASAMTKTGLDQALFRFTLRVSGSNPRSLLLGLMVTTMVASMVMSNTAITAVVIAAITPLLNTLDKKSGVAKALLLGVPIAATTGGMATIIGSPPNAIAAGILETIGIKIDFLDWMIFGLPVSLVLTALAYFALVLVYVKENSPISVELFMAPEKEVSTDLRSQRRIVIAVIVVTVLLWLTSSLHGLKVSSVAALPIVVLTLTGVLSGKDIRGIPWDTLFLVAGGMSLGVALQHTGLLTHYADMMSSLEVHHLTSICIIAFAAMLLSNIMSHTATSTFLIPMGLALVASLKIEVAVIVALASSTALFLPVSTPPNAIAYSTGLIEQKDFRLGGAVIGLVGPALIILWVMLAGQF